MKSLAALGLALLAANAIAATAYVSDELILGVYAEENNQGQRLATLHSGSSVETLSVSGEFSQVRLADGTTGWVKSAYLTSKVPATVRVKELEEELDRSRATTPELAEAAARSEVERLKRELAAAKQTGAEAPASAIVPAAEPAQPAADSPAPPWQGLPLILAAAAAVLLAFGGGFWLGYATLARRIRHKFGGIKVY